MITAAPMRMKIARITSAPMTPQSSTFCWWRFGTANWPRITAKMNRLSTERLFSTSQPEMYSMPDCWPMKYQTPPPKSSATAM